MTTEMTEIFVVENYHQGLTDCLMLIQRGQDMGLNLEDSVDATKKSILKSISERTTDEN